MMKEVLQDESLVSLINDTFVVEHNRDVESIRQIKIPIFEELLKHQSVQSLVNEIKTIEYTDIQRQKEICEKTKTEIYNLGLSDNKIELSEKRAIIGIIETVFSQLTPQMQLSFVQVFIHNDEKITALLGESDYLFYVCKEHSRLKESWVGEIKNRRI